jgi:hypothetical protein
MSLFARLGAGVEPVWGRSGDCQSQIVGAPLSVMRFVIAGKRGDPPRLRYNTRSCSIERRSALKGVVMAMRPESGFGDGEKREEPAASQMNMKYPFRYKCVCVVL